MRHLLLLDTLFGGSLLLGCRLLSFLHWRLLGSLLGGLLGCTLLGSWSLLGRALLGCLLSSRLLLSSNPNIKISFVYTPTHSSTNASYLCSGLLSAGSLHIEPIKTLYQVKTHSRVESVNGNPNFQKKPRADNVPSSLVQPSSSGQPSLLSNWDSFPKMPRNDPCLRICNLVTKA